MAFATHEKAMAISRRGDGVVHVGANLGQERELYEHYGLNVLWVEPIPEVFEQLKKKHCSFFPSKSSARAFG